MEGSAKREWYYRIGGITLHSAISLPSFQSFACEQSEADVIIERTEEQPHSGEGINAGSAFIRKSEGGWSFQPAAGNGICLYVNEDYTKLRLLMPDEPYAIWLAEGVIRMALECLLARRGYVTLHSACIALNGEAIAFSGPSGMGKSTRADAWIRTFGAELISGDRPLIHVKQKEVLGVPWDGKEKCFRNVCYPLRGIYEVRRSDRTYVREMSFEQRRRLLLRQCFMPMWDTETAAVQMMNITQLARDAEMFRVFGGPTEDDARELREMLEKHQYLQEGKDLKAKSGFVLRNVADEYLLMHAGDNISQFNGTMRMNQVSAFVWEKLQNPVSCDDLLQYVLNEYEIDEVTASADLDELLEKLQNAGVIENDG